MEKKRACLLSLFKRLSSSFRKESQEHVTTLQGALEFCHLLIACDDSISVPRTLTVTPLEVASYLGWKAGGLEMQYSKYAQEKKETVKKEEKEKEKEKEKAVKEASTEEAGTNQKEEESTEKEMEVEVKQEETEPIEEKEEEPKKEEVKKEEIKKEEKIKKEEHRKEEDTLELVHPLKLLEKQVVVCYMVHCKCTH